MGKRSVERRQARREKARERWGTTEDAFRGQPKGVEGQTDKTDTDRDQRGRQTTKLKDVHHGF